MKKSLVLVFCVFMLTMGLTAGEKKNEVNAFPVCYFISTPQASGPTFQVNLMVYDHSITGFGKVTGFGHNPRRDVKLEGSFGMIGEKRVAYIDGYEELLSTHRAPLKVTVARLYMVISEDWKSAKATYCFLDSNWKWKWVSSNLNIVQYKKCF